MNIKKRLIFSLTLLKISYAKKWELSCLVASWHARFCYIVSKLAYGRHIYKSSFSHSKPMPVVIRHHLNFDPNLMLKLEERWRYMEKDTRHYRSCSLRMNQVEIQARRKPFYCWSRRIIVLTIFFLFPCMACLFIDIVRGHIYVYKHTSFERGKQGTLSA